MRIGLKLPISVLLLVSMGLVAGDQPASNLCEPAGIHDHAMTHSVSNGRPADRTTSFSTNDDVAISWIESGNDLHCSHSVSWNWYSPDGKFFKTDTKTTGTPYAGYYFERVSIGAPLPIRGYDSANMPGLWRVEIYVDGDYYTTESFSINPEKKENTASYWFDRGNEFFENGSYDLAASCYNKANEIEPQILEAWYNKGLALSKMGKYDEAIQAFDRVLLLNSSDAAAWRSKGVVFASQGKYDDAIKAYDEAIRLDPNNAMAYYAKGAVLKAQGKTSESDAAYAKANELGYSG